MAWATRATYTRASPVLCLQAQCQCHQADWHLSSCRLLCGFGVAGYWQNAGHVPLEDLVRVPSIYSAPAPLQDARWHGTHLLFTRMQVICYFAEGVPSSK